MPIQDLIEELAAAGIYLAVQDGKLVCKAEAGALTPERRGLVAARKAELIDYLGSGAAPRATDEPPLQRRAGTTSVLSPTQRRLWFLDRLIGAGANYTVPVTFRLSGALDPAVLRRAFQRVVDRHESLRTVIGEHEGEPQARVRDDVVVAMAVESLEALPAAGRDAEVRARLQATLADPFDLATEVPFRARLFRLGPDEHVLMLTFHHIATDAWSVENLLRELSALYAAFAAGAADPLPPLALQYGDYATWLHDWLGGDRLQGLLEHWRERLAEAPAVHALPFDRPRPAAGVRLGGSWRQRLDASLHRAARRRRPPPRRHAVHDAAGGVRGAGVALERRGGRRRRHAGRQPPARGAGAAGRVLRQHAGAAQPHRRGRDVRAGAGPGRARRCSRPSSTSRCRSRRSSRR
jgi:hypothetical protein